MSCRSLNLEVLEEGFLSSFDTVISDLDGVIWIGSKALPGAKECFTELRKLGKKIIFLSNDDTQTRKKKLETFKNNGIEVLEKELFTSSQLAALYVSSLGISKEKLVYPVAVSGVVDELKALGYTCLPTGPDPVPEDYMSWFNSGANEVEVGAVIVGLDIFFSFPKMLKCRDYLQDPSVPLIATFADETMMRPNGRLMPGPAGIVAAVSAASEREAFIVGKPSLFALQCIQKEHPDVKPGRCLVIGDCLTTDVRFGRSASATTLLLLSGVSTLDDVRRCQMNDNPKQDTPDYYIQSLQAFYELLQNRKS